MPVRFHFLRTVIAATVAGAAAPCHAVVGLHDLSPGVYELLPQQAPFSGLVRVTAGTGITARTGSGFILNDYWMVTAAHVVWGTDTGQLTAGWPGGVRRAAQVYYPGEWLAAPEVGLEQGGDLALIRLESPFAFGRETRIAGQPVSGRAAVILGAGRGGNGLVGAFAAATARGATNTIDREWRTPGGGGLMVTDFDNGSTAANSLNADTVSRRYYDVGFYDPLLSTVLLEDTGTLSSAAFEPGQSLKSLFPALPDIVAEGTTASGDSGGPLFVYDRHAGEWEMAGLTSWGVNPILAAGFSRFDSRYGDVSFYTDLTRHRDWIAAIIPEPAGDLLMLTGLGVLLLRRKRD